MHDFEKNCSAFIVCDVLLFLGAPKALMDPSLSEVTAVVGEPYRIRIPFKGSPVPTAQFFNVR